MLYTCSPVAPADPWIQPRPTDTEKDKMVPCEAYLLLPQEEDEGGPLDL